ncbi:YjcQ family protein [Holdemanella biformis]
MARDDYYVIVYQILSYLYRSLKEGTEVDPKMLSFDGYLFKINERYWLYIIENMVNDEYISGVQVVKAWGQETTVSGLADAMITPKGIDYLCDNKTIKRAYEFAKDILQILPIKL